MAGTKVRGITIELSADASGISSSLRQINSELKSTQSDLRDIDKLLKLDPSNTELLAQKQSALQKALGETESKLQTLTKAEQDLSAQMVNGGTEEQQRQLDALRREIVSTETDMKKYNDQLVQTQEQMEGSSASTINFGEVVKGVGIAAAAAFTALVAATAAVISSMSKLITETAEYGDNVDKMSQKMGISSDTYQEWSFVMQHCGTSIDTLKTGMKTLATAAETGNAAFEKLGLTQEEIANMSQEDLFAATIEGLQNVEDTTERTYLAGQLLGRGATELGALLNMSAEETAAMKEQVHELGGVMSEEDVKASAAFKDSLQNLNTAFDGFTRNLAATFLPAITTIMDGMTEVITGNTEEGMAVMSEGIIALADQITTQIPVFLDVATQIILALVEGFLQNLPQIVESIIQIMTSVAQTLVDNIDKIIEAAIQIILALINGLIEALPKLIQYLPQIIVAIVTTLMDNIDLIIEAGVQLLIALIINLPKAIIEIVKAAPQIIAALAKGIAAGVSTMAEAGLNLLRGLWNGISSGISWLWNKISGWLSSLWSNILSFFGIHSPSKQMAWVGEMLAEGLAGGIEAEGDVAISAADDLVNGVNDAFSSLANPDMNANVSGVLSTSISGSASSAQNMASIYSLLNQYLPTMQNLALYLDSGELVGAVAPKMNNQFARMNELSLRGAY